MFEIYLIYTHLHQQLSECFYGPLEGARDGGEGEGKR